MEGHRPRSIQQREDIMKMRSMKVEKSFVSMKNRFNHDHRVNHTMHITKTHHPSYIEPLPNSKQFGQTRISSWTTTRKAC
ncbi:hypothetical protein SESBI_33606 [Sesbania bispinosa]|nr:hypothetical protein SESBI_33606 [Sesbania bispinosa]